jgi:putrescine transport system permease protein
MRIYSQVRLGVTPQINAVSTIMIGLAGLILVLGYVGGGRGRRRS